MHQDTPSGYMVGGPVSWEGPALMLLCYLVCLGWRGKHSVWQSLVRILLLRTNIPSSSHPDTGRGWGTNIMSGLFTSSGSPWQVSIKILSLGHEAINPPTLMSLYLSQVMARYFGLVQRKDAEAVGSSSKEGLGIWENDKSFWPKYCQVKN